MGALTADRSMQRRMGDKATYLAGVDVLYNGGLVALNTSGYAVAGSNTAGYRFAGVADGQVDNSGGAAGDLSVQVFRRGEFKYKFSGTAAQTDVGKPCYIYDDQTVRTTQGAGAVCCGEIVEVASDGDVWVDIEPATRERQLYEVWLRGSLTAGTTTTGGDVLGLANPFGARAVIIDFILDVTTAATGAATADAGVAADATTSADTLLDGVDIGTAAIIANNIDNAGTNGGRGIAWGSTQYITVTPSATAAGLVGTYAVLCLVSAER